MQGGVFGVPVLGSRMGMGGQGKHEGNTKAGCDEQRFPRVQRCRHHLVQHWALVDS